MNRLAERLREPMRPAGPELLSARIDALSRFVRATEPYLPAARLAPSRAVVARAGQRLALSREHTVVALAGPTGSGKSSLFNAIAGMRLSPVGVRRPTTAETYACVWGPPTAAGDLLDWLAVSPELRYARESILDGDDQAKLRGLVLLDLPDFDSVENAHRLEVDRLLQLVDLVVWVVDPQKYADKVVHNSYLAEFHRHREVTVVALNQADTLRAADLTRLMADLRRLLDADGLPGVPALPTSAVDAPAGLAQLRAGLERAVTDRRAALRRLGGDLDRVVADLADLIGPRTAKDTVDRLAVRRLTDALAWSAGVTAVVAAVEGSYRHRAAAATGWPLVRWVRRLRTDPLRRLGLNATPPQDAPLAAAVLAAAAAPGVVLNEPAVPVRPVRGAVRRGGKLPTPSGIQRSATGLAVRTVASSAGADLPAPWPDAVTEAARSRLDDLPAALDRAIAETEVGAARTPLWWRLVGGAQWALTAAALAGLGWLAVGLVVSGVGLSLEPPRIGAFPVPALLLFGGPLVGLLLAGVTRWAVGWAARQARARAESQLLGAIGEVGRDYVVAPVGEVLQAYSEARESLLAAGQR